MSTPCIIEAKWEHDRVWAIDHDCYLIRFTDAKGYEHANLLCHEFADIRDLLNFLESYENRFGVQQPHVYPRAVDQVSMHSIPPALLERVPFYIYLSYLGD